MRRIDAHARRLAYPRRVACLVVALAALAAALLPSLAAAASPFRHSLARVDAHLRMAIEILPAELGEELVTAENVCALGQQAEARDDEQAAQADWSTLTQTVTELSRPTLRSIDGAFGRADADLRSLEKRFSAAWAGQTAKVRELRLGVARTRHGVSRVVAAMDGFDDALAAWEGRRCGAAQRAIDRVVRRIPPPIEAINYGMLRLWRLLDRG